MSAIREAAASANRTIRISIIVPVHNRPALLARALESLRAEASSIYEVVVSDDGSSERPDQVVAEYSGILPIKLIRHEDNRGVGATRNAAVAESSGDWCLMLDSDDELVPGAFSVIAETLASAEDDCQIATFRARWDDGYTSPPGLTVTSNMTFPQYLAFLEQHVQGSVEMMYAIRPGLLRQTPYPEVRVDAPLFYLRLHSQTRGLFSHFVARRYHQHPQQLTGAVASGQADTAEASRALVDHTAVILSAYGAEMRRESPQYLATLLRRGAVHAVMVDQGSVARRFARLAVSRRFNLKNAATLVLTILPPSLVRLLRQCRLNARTRRGG